MMTNFLNYTDEALSKFTIDFYNLSDECIKKGLNDTYLRGYYGETDLTIKDNLDGSDMANNFHYLYSLLVIAYYEYAKDGFSQDEKETFHTTYNIECVKKTFLCWGCDITPIIERFVAIYSNVKSGINYNTIQGTFIIK